MSLAPPALLRRLLLVITWTENAVLIALLALMVVLAGSQIVFRNLLDLSLLGVDQLLRLLVLWVALLGAVTASRDDKHINIDLFSRFLPARAHAVVRVITHLFTVAICVLLAWHAGRFVASERTTGELAFTLLPMWIAQLILPAAFGLIALRYVILLVKNARAAWRGHGLS
jgi:TRAP-type C4-dicarboxylate transport system permease small subunit